MSIPSLVPDGRYNSTATDINMLLCSSNDCLAKSSKQITTGSQSVLSSVPTLLPIDHFPNAPFSEAQNHIDSIALKLLVVFYILLFFFTIAGNTIVLLVVISRAKTGATGWGMLWKGTDKWTPHRSPFLVLQTSMAIADLCVGCICIPVVLSELFYGYYPFHGAMCRIYITIQGTARAANTWFICAICLHRYFQTTNPRLLRRHFCQKRALIAVAGIWLGGFFVSVPSTITMTVIPADYRNDQLFYCEEIWTNKTAHLLYGVFILLVMLLIPSGLLIICYSRLIQSIRNLAVKRSNKIRLRLTTDTACNMSDAKFGSWTTRSQRTPATGITNVANFTDDVCSANRAGEQQFEQGNDISCDPIASCAANCSNANVTTNKTCSDSKSTHEGNIEDLQMTSYKRQDQQQRQAIRLLITISVCFILSWTPYYLISTGNIIRDILPKDHAVIGSHLNFSDLSFYHPVSYATEDADGLNTVMVIVSYALFFGHFHSCHNAVIYLLLDSKGRHNCCANSDTDLTKRRRGFAKSLSTVSSPDVSICHGIQIVDRNKVYFAKRPPPLRRLHSVVLGRREPARSDPTNGNFLRESRHLSCSSHSSLHRLKMPVDPNKITLLKTQYGAVGGDATN